MNLAMLVDVCLLSNNYLTMYSFMHSVVHISGFNWKLFLYIFLPIVVSLLLITGIAIVIWKTKLGKT